MVFAFLFCDFWFDDLSPLKISTKTTSDTSGTSSLQLACNSVTEVVYGAGMAKRFCEH